MIALSRAALVLTVLATVVGCTEPNHAVQSAPAPTPSLVARIELSDSLPKVGGELRVTVRIVGATIGSATARIVYDSASLTFIDEEAISDGATRAMNPTPGLVRMAAVAEQGISEGRVSVLRFSVRRADAVQSIKLFVDEMHTVSQARTP
jgi:hypothetical protein